MENLLEIIQTKCLPQRNCMLTVSDVNGETGFLYFKEAQLIEANSGADWGMDALKLVCGWNIDSYHVSDIPMGIKRTLWEPVDKIFEQLYGEGVGQGLRDAAASAPAAPLEPQAVDGFAEMRASGDPLADILEKVSEINGFQALLRDDGKMVKLLQGTPLPDEFNAEFFAAFNDMLDQMGTGLGAGFVEGWYLELSDRRLWRVPYGNTDLIVASDIHCLTDEFEAALKEAVGAN